MAASVVPYETPLVSIVITAYNAERFIGGCIKAALAQTYADFEVLVVDDGSTDRTAEICRSFTDPRFHYVTWGRLGRAKALNAGIEAARGEYIAINDADDLSLPHRLQYTIDFLQRNPGVAYAGTHFATTDVFTNEIPHELAEMCRYDAEGRNLLWPTPAQIFRRNLFNHSTLAYPKSTWQKVGGYDEQLATDEDYDFYIRAMQVGPAVLLPVQTVIWYTNPGGFFKRIDQREHRMIMGFIRRRAHGLFKLPIWLKLYHPMWLVGVRCTHRCPVLLKIIKRLRTPSQRPSMARSG